MGEQLLEQGGASASSVVRQLRAIRGVLRTELPSGRHAAQLAAVLAGPTVALWVIGGAAAGGLGLLALAAAVVALERPYLLGPLVALVLPFGDRAHVLQAQVAPLEAVVGGGAIGYVICLTRRRELRLHAFHWAFAALVVCIGLSALGPAEDSRQVRELAFWGALGFVCHAVTTDLDSRRTVRLLLVALALPTLVEASLALFEYVDNWSQRLSQLNGAIVYPLPKGTLSHPNALAQFLVLAGFALFAIALAERGLLRRCGLLAAGVAGLALVVTFSRASWIAFAAGTCVFLLERKSRARVLGAGAAVAVGAVLLALVSRGAIGERISSLFTSSGLASFRVELWKVAARIAADHPLTGAGQFREAGIYAGRPDVATHPHSLFLGLAVFYGIPAAVAFAGLVLIALRATWRGFRRVSAPDRVTALGFLALLVALVVNGVFEYPFWNPSLTTLVVLVLAIAVTLDREPPDAHEPLAPR